MAFNSAGSLLVFTIASPNVYFIRAIDGFILGGRKYDACNSGS